MFNKFMAWMLRLRYFRQDLKRQDNLYDVGEYVPLNDTMDGRCFVGRHNLDHNTNKCKRCGAPLDV